MPKRRDTTNEVEKTSYIFEDGHLPEQLSDMLPHLQRPKQESFFFNSLTADIYEQAQAPSV